MSRIWVTKHAKRRCQQRLRLFMYEGEDPNKFLIGQYKHAKKDMKIEHTPFYKNKLQSIHGAGAFMASTKNITFCCSKKDNGDTIIHTVYRNEEML